MIGIRIKQLREELGITQSELGKKLGVVKQTISSWENDVSNPNNEAIALMANIFNVSTDYLLGNSNNSSLRESLSENSSSYFFFFDEMLKNVFTTRFKKVLDARSISLAQFSVISNIDNAKCEDYFNGKYEPSLEDLITISQTLNVSTDYLLGQINIQAEKALNGFKQLNEDNKDIIVGDTKKYIKEQQYEGTVAADEDPLGKVAGK
ncbi:MAG: helix-turn-helix domain-containing protein [Clostridium sp.]|nr:helix-turn-helix domain-containing protein [Clostridium sp.]